MLVLGRQEVLKVQAARVRAPGGVKGAGCSC